MGVQKRRFKGIFISILIISILTACSGNNSSDTSSSGQNNNSSGNSATASVQIRLAHVGSEQHQYHIGAEKFKELIEEKSNGEISVQIFSNGQLGSEGDAVEGIQNGTIDMTVVVADGDPANIVPELNVLGIPYLFRDREHVYNVLDGEIGEELLQLGDDNGLIGLGYWEIGFANFTNSKRAIQEPGDMAGLSFRVQTAPIWNEFMQRLGSLPVPMSFNELYSAMEQGVVDGQENPIATINSMKFYEVSPYIALTRHTYKAGVVYVSERIWSSLSEEQQALLSETVKETYKYQRDFLEEKERETIEELSTLDYITITEPNIEAFVELTQGIEETMANQVPQELVDRIKAQ